MAAMSTVFYGAYKRNWGLALVGLGVQTGLALIEAQRNQVFLSIERNIQRDMGPNYLGPLDANGNPPIGTYGRLW